MSISDFDFFKSCFLHFKGMLLGEFHIKFQKNYHFTQKNSKIANEKKRAFERK